MEYYLALFIYIILVLYKNYAYCIRRVIQGEHQQREPLQWGFFGSLLTTILLSSFSFLENLTENT